MSAGWTAGTVRARGLAQRSAGVETARLVAVADGLPKALSMLSRTTYGRRLHQGMDLRAAESAVEHALLWNLRVLAGWQPRKGVEVLRVAACGFEAANVLGRIRELDGAAADEPYESHEPYELGALAAAWPGVRRARSAEEVRRALVASPWGDPDSTAPAAVASFLRLSGAARLSMLNPTAARWAAGDAAVAVGREVYLADRRLGDAAARLAMRLLGRTALQGGTWDEYVSRLPETARWAVAGVRKPEDLWRAEAKCRLRKEAEGLGLLRRSTWDAESVLGAAVVLSTDAWRVRAALESAARNGRSREAFDVVA